MIDKHASLRHKLRHNRNVERNLIKSIWRSLLVDSRRRTEKAVEEIGVCMEPTTGIPDLRGGYSVLIIWYPHSSSRAINPSQADLAKVAGYYAALHWR